MEPPEGAAPPTTPRRAEEFSKLHAAAQGRTAAAAGSGMVQAADCHHGCSSSRRAASASFSGIPLPPELSYAKTDGKTDSSNVTIVPSRGTHSVADYDRISRCMQIPSAIWLEVAERGGGAQNRNGCQRDRRTRRRRRGRRHVHRVAPEKQKSAAMALFVKMKANDVRPIELILSPGQ